MTEVKSIEDSMPSIRSLEDLDRLEKKVGRLLRQHSLDEVLLSLRAVGRESNRNTQIRPFMVAAATKFAIRYCLPGPFAWSGRLVPWTDLDRILYFAGAYALADPASWDPDVPKSTLSIMLRHAANQFCFEPSIEGKWGRAEILWNELPRKLRMPASHSFDFRQEFERDIGVTVADFIDVGYVAYSAAVSTNQLGFARDYFEAARRQGILIAGDEVVRKVLASMAATKSEHAQKQRQTRQKDTTFAAYDYSSLMVYPLVRPWDTSGPDLMAADRMIAPIPEMIAFRISMGIYYDMHARHGGTFDRYFGHLFEAYVGYVLRASLGTSTELLSEADIRVNYPEKFGKVPDWIVIEGKTAVLIESKTVRLKREICVTGSEQKLKENLSQVVVGLKQTKEFGEAILRRAAGLERLHRCDEIVRVVVTPEHLYLSSSVPFTSQLRETIPDLGDIQWSLLSIDQLEWFQPHLSAGVGTAELFSRTMSHSHNTVIAWAHNRTGKTYGDSMLCAKEGQLHDRLGIPRLAAG